MFSPPSAAPFTLVTGNASCDLDSLISAVLYAYFHSASNQAPSRTYVPLLNLPSVPATDLWRLRPEFGTALKLATGGQDEKQILHHLVTYNDISSDRPSVVLTQDGHGKDDTIGASRTDIILVDHNRIDFDGRKWGNDLELAFSVKGCIDHHVDEDFVPLATDPRIIEMGIGSCTSLVIEHLRRSGLWPPASSKTTSNNVSQSHVAEDSKTSDVESSQDWRPEMAKLALAAILIDTTDLKAKGKVSSTDTEAVEFLEAEITSSAQAAQERPHPAAEESWDRSKFYEEIAHSKKGSLDQLTIPEILGRDYKEWAEQSADNKGGSIKIGIASIVQPLSWLVSKASKTESTDGSEGASSLLSSASAFAKERELDILGFMTTSTSSSGNFQRELLVWAINDQCLPVLDRFSTLATSKFELETWDAVPELKDHDPNNSVSRRIWWQREVSKSRKQVAPLLRSAASQKQ